MEIFLLPELFKVLVWLELSIWVNGNHIFVGVLKLIGDVFGAQSWKFGRMSFQ